MSSSKSSSRKRGAHKHLASSSSASSSSRLARLHDKPRFWSRVSALYSSWRRQGKVPGWSRNNQPIDALILFNIKSSSSRDKKLATGGKDYGSWHGAAQFLFGSEMVLKDSIIIIAPSTVHILTTRADKANLFQNLLTTEEKKENQKNPNDSPDNPDDVKQPSLQVHVISYEDETAINKLQITIKTIINSLYNSSRHLPVGSDSGLVPHDRNNPMSMSSSSSSSSSVARLGLIQAQPRSSRLTKHFLLTIQSSYSLQTSASSSSSNNPNNPSSTASSDRLDHKSNSEITDFPAKMMRSLSFVDTTELWGVFLAQSDYFDPTLESLRVAAEITSKIHIKSVLNNALSLSLYLSRSLCVYVCVSMSFFLVSLCVCVCVKSALTSISSQCWTTFSLSLSSPVVSHDILC